MKVEPLDIQWNPHRARPPLGRSRADCGSSDHPRRWAEIIVIMIIILIMMTIIGLVLMSDHDRNLVMVMLNRQNLRWIRVGCCVERVSTGEAPRAK